MSCQCRPLAATVPSTASDAEPAKEIVWPTDHCVADTGAVICGCGAPSGRLQASVYAPASLAPVWGCVQLSSWIRYVVPPTASKVTAACRIGPGTCDATLV